MNVSVAVQHHPARADVLPALLDRVGPAAVIADPDPFGAKNPWRTYRAALLSTPTDATHRLIVQDDVLACDRFREAVDAAVDARPDRVLVLWHGGQPRENVARLERARKLGEVWVQITIRWVPAVAVVWPARLIRPVVEWVDQQNYPVAFRADDEILCRALKALGEPVLACAPSLVEHEDTLPSLLGMRAKAGRDRGRVAASWIGQDDPMALDWTSGAA